MADLEAQITDEVEPPLPSKGLFEHVKKGRHVPWRERIKWVFNIHGSYEHTDRSLVSYVDIIDTFHGNGRHSSAGQLSHPPASTSSPTTMTRRH